MTNERNNLCFTRSFIHSDDADAYFTDSMNILDEGQYDVTEANIDLINEKWVVRILAVPRQGELFD